MARAEELLRRSGLQAITDNADDFITLFDLEFRHLFVNRAIAQTLGREPEDFVGQSMTEAGMPPELAERLGHHLEIVVATGQSQKLEYEMALPAGRRSMQTMLGPIKAADGTVEALIAITRDVTDRKRAETLRDSQNEVMRAIAGGAGLDELLQRIAELAQRNLPGRHCSILLTGEQGRRLSVGAAGSVPAALLESICAQPVGPDNACCGAAAFLGHLVIATDLAADARWTAHRALTGELQACWAQPILAPDGRVLGSLALYLKKSRSPTESELAVMNELALIAALAIDHRQTLDSLLQIRERYQALAEHASNIISVTDMKGVVRETSPAIKAILGYEPGEMIGRNSYEFVHPDDIESLKNQFRRLRDQVGTEVMASYRYRHRDGSWRVLETIAKSRTDHRGEYLSVVNSRDITESERMTQALRVSEERLARALAASDLGMWDWHIDTGALYLDRSFAEIMGYELGDVPARIDWLSEQLPPNDRARVGAAFTAHLKGETERCELDYQARTRSGEWKWIHLRGQVIERSADGRARRMTGTNRDITATRLLQDSLDQAQTRVQLLLEATDEGIIGLDAHGVVSFVNPAATRMLGYTADRMLGNELFDLVQHVSEGGVEMPRAQTPAQRSLTEHLRFRSGDDLFWRNANQLIPVEYSVSPILAGDEPAGAVLIAHDVTEKRSMAHQLHFQALHDPLTGLVNRRGFEIRLNEMLGSAKNEGREHALCYIDLDQFKLVNDTCGHAAGDELLRLLPNVLQPLVRGSDIVARLGGDEFGILLQDCTLDRAAQMAGLVRDAVRGFRFVWQYRTFTIGASIGVVGITGESQGLVAVLGAADTACYVAKDQGPNHVHVSYPHDLAIIRRRGEMRWIARLKTALEENRFTLYYQSIVSFDEPQTRTHHEMLIRLLDSKGEVILPGAFIAAAERYQLMPSIDAWVIENALRYIGEVIAPQRELRHHRFGINLSGESLRDVNLLDNIRQLLARHRVPPTMLYFEITETAAISNLGAAVEFMRSLKQIGCQLALDDFGSGMSSFSYLKHLPVDYLKIDGSFVKDLLINPIDEAIVRAINSVGQKMGIKTIAEYVESPGIAERLREIGVNYGQGFSIAAPLPLVEFSSAFRQTGAVGS